MKTPKYIPEISPAVFWDVPKEDIDYTKHSDFIICRVFNYGNFQEVADVIVCYGKEYVKKLLLSTKNLNVFGLSVASAFFGIPEKQFTSYERIQHRFFKSDEEVKKAWKNLRCSAKSAGDEHPQNVQRSHMGRCKTENSKRAERLL